MTPLYFLAIFGIRSSDFIIDEKNILANKEDGLEYVSQK